MTNIISVPHGSKETCRACRNICSDAPVGRNMTLRDTGKLVSNSHAIKECLAKKVIDGGGDNELIEAALFSEEKYTIKGVKK